MSEIGTREARGEDIPEIAEIFYEAYGPDYPYTHFYDEDWLLRSVYGDDMVMVVAEDGATGELLGTGSVVFDVGAHSDLTGEFGRLVVRESARGRGVGKLIMEERLRIIEPRIHIGVVENRTAHAYSQKISRDFGFVPVGFLPLKHRFRERESIALFARHFGPALELRGNHPRIVPEVAHLGHLSMMAFNMKSDLIVDEVSEAYPHDEDFVLSSLVAEGMPALLRIARGRVRSREVFGPMRLHYGFFKLAAREAHYLVARREGACQEAITGAMGFLHDPIEKSFRIFEVIAATDDAVRHLFTQVLELAMAQDVHYVEVEVSAHAPRLQRTLIELGFLPAAYVPAMVFQDVERLDVVKMVRLLIPPEIGSPALIDEARPIFEAVMKAFETGAVLPTLSTMIASLPLFDGLAKEQARRLASAMRVETFAPGHRIFECGDAAHCLYIILEGVVEILGQTPEGAEPPIAVLSKGHVLGENATLSHTLHSATALVHETATLAVLSLSKLDEVVRRRPDIAVIVYRNLAIALGGKLRKADEVIARLPQR